MRSPLPVIGVIVVYLLFVLKLGPAFMKHRPPFKLDRIIQVYNLIQVYLCSILVYRVSFYFYVQEIVPTLNEFVVLQRGTKWNVAQCFSII